MDLMDYNTESFLSRIKIPFSSMMGLSVVCNFMVFYSQFIAYRFQTFDGLPFYLETIVWKYVCLFLPLFIALALGIICRFMEVPKKNAYIYSMTYTYIHFLLFIISLLAFGYSINIVLLVFYALSGIIVALLSLLSFNLFSHIRATN